VLFTAAGISKVNKASLCGFVFDYKVSKNHDEALLLLRGSSRNVFIAQVPLPVT
jgi:hypothetical protein